MMRKLYQQIAEAVASSIRHGEYVAGQRLPPERELAEQFGVSRPTVREAMIALEIRGIVEPRHGSGIYVVEGAPAGPAPEMDSDIGAFELTEARSLFEGEAAALAATCISDEELAEIETILGQMVEENEQGVQGELADRRFHLAIARATKNSAILAVVEMLWDLRQKSSLAAEMLERSRLAGVQPAIEEHQAVFKALKARDSHGARAAMRRHLDRVIDDLLRATEMEAVERARSEIEAKRSEIARRRAV